MDHWTAFVAIAHLKLRLEILQRLHQRHPEYLKDIEMATPKLQGLAKAMAMLEHNMEDGAGKLLAKIQSVEARGVAALSKANQRIDSKATIVDEIEGYVTALEGSNGGDPLDDSPASSVPTVASTGASTPIDAASTVPPADRTVAAN